MLTMDKTKIQKILEGVRIALFGSNLRTLSIAHIFQQLNIDVVSVQSDSEKVDLHDFDLCILAGWSKLVKAEDLTKPRYGFINCHAGKLPEYRGSSPLNWSLLNNEKQFGLSVISADASFDTGSILVTREFDILASHGIRDLHAIANSNFPEMVIEACVKKVLGLEGYKQPNNCSKYYPLRSPEDGEINWYLDDAEKIAQKIKALGPPYHGCYCYFRSNKVFFSKTISIDLSFCGEVSKIYRVKQNQILVSTKAGAIWVEYRCEDALSIKPYEVFDK